MYNPVVTAGLMVLGFAMGYKFGWKGVGGIAVLYVLSLLLR